MKTVAILRQTDSGKRAFPIAHDDAERLVSEGQAFKHNRGLYEYCAAIPAVSEPEQLHSESDNTYDTKVMEPAKRRGRPPKYTKAV